jgi:hypothetical protein
MSDKLNYIREMMRDLQYEDYPVSQILRVMEVILLEIEEIIEVKP